MGIAGYKSSLIRGLDRKKENKMTLVISFEEWDKKHPELHRHDHVVCEHCEGSGTVVEEEYPVWQRKQMYEAEISKTLDKVKKWHGE